MKDHKEALQNNFDFLRDSLEPESLADFLFTKGKITKADQESISFKQENKGRTAASRKCLEILINSGPDTFECLKDFLRSHCSRYFILEKLEKEMVEEIRVCMFGKTGVGKSFLGNNILGQTIFSAQGNAQSATTKLTRGEKGIGNNYKLVLIDTPGLFDTFTNDNMKTAKILASTVKETKPGPHIFIFVLSLGNRFTAEERAAVEFLKDLFGNHVTDYMIIVFTRKDDLEYNNMNLDTYIDNAGEGMKSIVNQCQGMMAINNHASPEEVAKSVDSLLTMIKRVYLHNNKTYYTDKLMAEAQAIFNEKLRQQEEEAHKRERELEAERDLMIIQHKTEFKEYQDKKKLETEKLEEDIKKNQIVMHKREEEAHRSQRELAIKYNKLRGEKDLLISQHKTEFKEYQDIQELKNQKHQEDIRKQQILMRKRDEEAHRRERELKDKQKQLTEEKDLIITQHKTQFKEYQVKQQLKIEKHQEDMKKEKEQNKILLRQQEEEAHRRERELKDKQKQLTEEKDLIITQHKTQFKEYQVKQQLKIEKHQEDMKKEKEQNKILLRQQEEEADRRERKLEAEKKKLTDEKEDIITKYITELKEYQDYIKNDKENNHTKLLQQEENARNRERELDEEARKRERILAQDQKDQGDRIMGQYITTIEKNEEKNAKALEASAKVVSESQEINKQMGEVILETTKACTNLIVEDKDEKIGRMETELQKKENKIKELKEKEKCTIQ